MKPKKRNPIITILAILGGFALLFVVCICLAVLFVPALNNSNPQIQRRATLPPLNPPATPTRAGPTATPTVLQGQGDHVLQFTSPNPGLAIFDIECAEPAERQCSVWLLDEQGNKLDLLANDLTPYSGQKSAQLQPVPYVIEVTAPGPWSINITLP